MTYKKKRGLMHLKKNQLEKICKKYALTARQIEYIKLLFLGINDNQIIAQELENTLLTAKIHITNIYKKLHESHKLAVVIKIIKECKLLHFNINDPPKELIEKFQQKYNLTNRETELFKILCKGITANKEIGNVMNIHFETTKIHQKFLYRKTLTNNKLALVIKFIDESE